MMGGESLQRPPPGVKPLHHDKQRHHGSQIGRTTLATFESPEKPERNGGCTYFYPGTKVRLNVINVIRRGVISRDEINVMKKLLADGDDHILIAAKMGVSTGFVYENLKDERRMPKSGRYGDSHGDPNHGSLFPDDDGFIEE